jgi:hypothetical protein
MKPNQIILLGLIVHATSIACAQTTELAQVDTGSLLSISSKYIDQVTGKSEKLNQKLDQQTEKALMKWQKQDEKIRKKLARIDSSKAKELFSHTEHSVQQFKNRIQNSSLGSSYVPSLDTMLTSLKFLEQNKELLSKAKLAKDQLSGALDKVKNLQSGFSKADEIKKFLKERKELLRNQLRQLGFAKELKKLNKQAYYYSQQVNEYKSILKDYSKAEKKAIELLSKTKLFKDFMRRNSQLASLFRLPGNPDEPPSLASLAGLQTRTQVNSLIQQQIASGGANAQAQFQQNVQEAQSRISELKSKVLQLGGSSSDDILAEGFRPNNQKTKSFLQRLEYGTNIQSQKAQHFFPVTSDIGLSLGYRISDQSLFGIGASYKLGLGKNIRNINVTHQGVGLRSFIDWKLKGSFWISGGFEMNYRNVFNRIDVLKDFDAWQRSGLIGMSKVISLKTKFFKKTKLQLLWDFLSYEQVPRTQALVFRVGYSIK